MRPLHDTETTLRTSAAPALAGRVLLVAALVALLVSFFLPWWSIQVIGLTHSHVSEPMNFHRWGWLSVAAWLLAIMVALRLFFPRLTSRLPMTRHLEGRTTAWVTLAAGAFELLGNALFIHAAPKTRFGVSAGVVASHGVGLDIAMGCGLAFLLSGLLLLAQRNRSVSSHLLRVRFAHPATAIWQRRQLPCPD